MYYTFHRTNYICMMYFVVLNVACCHTFVGLALLETQNFGEICLALVDFACAYIYTNARTYQKYIFIYLFIYTRDCVQMHAHVRIAIYLGAHICIHQSLHARREEGVQGDELQFTNLRFGVFAAR